MQPRSKKGFMFYFCLNKHSTCLCVYRCVCVFLCFNLSLIGKLFGQVFSWSVYQTLSSLRLSYANNVNE